LATITQSGTNGANQDEFIGLFPVRAPLSESGIPVFA
jgi:hypothetical protein